MKKILALLLALLIGASLVACTATGGENDADDVATLFYDDVDLAAVADSLYDGIAEDNRPFVMSIPLTAEDFEYSAFIPYEEGFEAVVNEPMIGSIAHSVVLVKCPTSEKAVEVAAAMKENCNPRKWVCVEADIVTATTNGNIAMLLMTTTEGGMSETIINNFAALDAEKIAHLKSEVVDDELIIEDELLVDGEDVVFEFDAEEMDDAPAAMPEEGDIADVMPAL